MNTLKFENEIILKLYGNSKEDIIDILNEYVSSKEEMLTSLYTSFSKGTEELLDSLHFHASVFSYVGFPQLTNECLLLENDCKKYDLSFEIQLRFNELVNKIKESTVIVEKEIDKLTSTFCF